MKSVVRAMALTVYVLVLSAAGAAPLPVTVSIPPLKTVAERVGGSLVSVSALMGENDDPHTYMPSPRRVAAVGDAVILFTVGMDFEERLCEKLQRMFPTLAIVDVSEGLLEEERDEHEGHDAHAGHGHDEHGHEGSDHALHDPHTWLSMPHLIQIAENMSAALQQKLPEKREELAERLAMLKREWQAVHATFGRQLADRRGATFYVYHPAFGYFAEDYGLVQKAIEVDGKAPSPRQLAELIRQAKQDDVRVIFVQPQFQQRTATMLADRIGGKIIPVNPLDPDPVGLLRQAAAAVRQTDGGR